jgi:hypothetical protein
MGIFQLAQGEQRHSLTEAIRDVAVHFGRNFAVSALGLHDQGQGNEFAARSKTQRSSNAAWLKPIPCPAPSGTH